jgi:Tol biopolymer transport system component/DNA-binding CsgD family transcriptional regulator
MRPFAAGDLSERRRQVLDGVEAGKSNGVLARELGVTVDGVKWHVSELLLDTGCRDRRELAEWWRRERRRAMPAVLAGRPHVPTIVGMGRVTAVIALTALISFAAYVGWTCDARSNQDATSATPGLGKIAYVQRGDIWSMTLPAGQPVRLTAEGGASAPKWSPSGQWLLYQTGDRWSVMRADGTGLRQVDGRPVWAPGGDDLAIGGDRIYVERADGSGVRALVRPPFLPSGVALDFRDLAWSADGRWLAYVEREVASGATPSYSGERLMKINTVGGDPVALFDPGRPPPEGLGVFGWSPDGRQVLFWAYPSFSADVADGIALEAVAAIGGSPHGFGYTDDGLLTFRDFQSWSVESRLAVTGGSGRETWTHKEIRVVESSGAYRVITDAGIAAIEPAFSPEGRRLAYVAMPDAGIGVSGGDPAKAALAQRKIWRIDSRGNGARALTADPAYRDEYPQWSADGADILFVRMDPQDRASIWMMGAGGSDPAPIVSDFDPNSAPSDAPWFGYYGHIAWDHVLDWWRPPS